MFFAVWDFIFSRSSFKSVLPMAFTCAVQTSTGASRRANRAGLQLRWCRSPTRPPKLHTRPHRAGLRLRWCRFPTLGSNHHTGANRAEFGFSPQNELTPPPKGGGVSYRLFGLLVFSRREARYFSAGKDGYFVSEGFSRQLPWQLLATTGSHGSNGACLVLRWCRFPTRPSKPDTGPHRAEFGFTIFSWNAFAPAGLPSPAPACSLLPPG